MRIYKVEWTQDGEQRRSWHENAKDANNQHCAKMVRFGATSSKMTRHEVEPTKRSVVSFLNLYAV